MSRHRISNWTSQEMFLNGSMTKPIRPFFKPKPSLLSAVWVDDGKGTHNRIRCIDDISLLVTISDNNERNDDGTPKMKPDWDKRFLRGDPDVPDFYRQIIQYCHDTLGVQCLIGWENKDAHKTAFEDWIMGAEIKVDRLGNRSITGYTGTPSPTVDVVAQSIVDFMDANLPEADGISFDIEGLGGSKAPENLRTTVRDNLTAFIEALARLLHSPKLVSKPKGRDPGYDRIVAVTAGPLIGHAKNSKGKSDGKMKKSRWLKHDQSPGSPLSVDANGDFITANDFTLANADWAFEVWDYNAAKAGNILIRPMAYDNSAVNAPNRLDDWHADIVHYVTHELNLHPGNFQLGIKTASGNAVMPSPSWVARRCKELLAPNDHGVIFFPQSGTFWNAANEALNPSALEAGKKAGEPLQCPLNAKAIARLRQTF
jgi:hypothetical protein